MIGSIEAIFMDVMACLSLSLVHVLIDVVNDGGNFLSSDKKEKFFLLLLHSSSVQQ